MALCLEEGKSFEYFDQTVSGKTAQQRFISTVYAHRNEKSGRVILSQMNATEMLSSEAYKDIDQIASLNFASDRNIFISLNEFRWNKRKSENCYAINAFPHIDIDAHDVAPEKLPEVIEEVQNRLKASFENGDVCVPTAMTFSGRGICLFYVLNNKIAVTPKTEGLRKFFYYTSGLLLKRFKKLLAGIPVEVDTSVKDNTRLVRLPGTINQSAQAECVMYDIPATYYEVKDIYNLCHLDEYDKRKQKTEVSNANILSFSNARSKKLNENRIEFYQNYISEMKQEKEKGWRETVVWLLYNSYVQIYFKKEADEKINKISEDLGLAKSRVRSLMRSVLSNKNTIGSGYYILRSSTICEKLGITPAKARSLGLKAVSGSRVNAKEDTAHNNDILKEIIQASFEEKRTIPERVLWVNNVLKEKNILRRNGSLLQISDHTLTRKIKELGLNRKGTLAYTETQEYKTEAARKEKVAQKARKTTCKKDNIISFSESAPKKLPKIATECIIPFQAKTFEERLTAMGLMDSLDYLWDMVYKFSSEDERAIRLSGICLSIPNVSNEKRQEEVVNFLSCIKDNLEQIKSKELNSQMYQLRRYSRQCFNKSLMNLDLIPIKKKRQMTPEQRRVAGMRYSVIKFFSRYNSNDGCNDMRGYMRRLNNQCRRFPDKIYVVNGKEYTADYIRRNVLFCLDIQFDCINLVRKNIPQEKWLETWVKNAQ